MSQLAVTVIGPDRPGIIADVTEALAGTGVNLEDSTMTLLRGHFAMMIVCAGPYDEVEAALEPLRGELVITVRTMGPEHEHAPIGAPYMLSVHGADRPGIVAAVTRMIASAGGTITDLATRLSGDGSSRAAVNALTRRRSGPTRGALAEQRLGIGDERVHDVGGGRDRARQRGALAGGEAHLIEVAGGLGRRDHARELRHGIRDAAE